MGCCIAAARCAMRLTADQQGSKVLPSWVWHALMVWRQGRINLHMLQAWHALQSRPSDHFPALTHSLHLQGLSPLILPVPRPQGCPSCFVSSVDNGRPLAQQLVGVLQRGVLITWIILCRMGHSSADWSSVWSRTAKQCEPLQAVRGTAGRSQACAALLAGETSVNSGRLHWSSHLWSTNLKLLACNPAPQHGHAGWLLCEDNPPTHLHREHPLYRPCGLAPCAVMLSRSAGLA